MFSEIKTYWIVDPGSDVALVALVTGFPRGLENLGKWEGIFQSGKSQRKSHKILENSGNF